jgi:hypothetical protein
VQEANIMFRSYSAAVEAAMQHTYAALNEQQRRLYAANEALKLGHGGITYIARLFGCHRKTIQRGLLELQHPSAQLPAQRARKKGADDSPASLFCPASMMRS